MSCTLTPYQKNGSGLLSTSGSSTTTNCDTAQGFRNVAIGATIISGGLTRTVVSKTDEDTVVVNSAWSLTNATWTYTNPVLTLSGCFYIKHNKNDKPTLAPIAMKDSNAVYACMGQGVIREIVFSGWIQSATLDDVINQITILESLVDGSQTKQGTCAFTEDTPPRSSYVYLSKVSWQYVRDKPNWVDIMIEMVECKNKGSL